VEAVRIRLNGADREVPAGLTVAALLDHLGLAPARVAVERNARVVPRADHAREPVAAGDRLEIVTFVGGGR
jgi:thiamine biosynthesis protein ThiS